MTASVDVEFILRTYRETPAPTIGADSGVDRLAYVVCQTGGHIPNRDRSLPGSCDFHRRTRGSSARLTAVSAMTDAPRPDQIDHAATALDLLASAQQQIEATGAAWQAAAGTDGEAEAHDLFESAREAAALAQGYAMVHASLAQVQALRDLVGAVNDLAAVMRVG